MTNKIISEKKRVLISILRAYIHKEQLTLNNSNSLFFERILELDGFDFEIFYNELKYQKFNIYELRIFLLIFERLKENFKITVKDLTKIYNITFTNPKLYNVSKAIRIKSLTRVFSLFKSINKYIRTDEKDFLEYKNENKNNLEFLFDSYIINSILNRKYMFMLNLKDKIIDDFLESINIKNNISKNELQVLENRFKLIYDFKNINVLPFPNSKKQEKIENINDNKRKDIYTIYNEKAYYNFDLFDKEIVKKIYEIIPRASNYTIPYNKNKILLQKLANDEIEKKHKDLIEELKNNGVKISEFGFSRIYDIKKSWCDFNLSYSIKYPDFVNSEAIKGKDYFEIILEYKKGSATKDYLDLFLKEQREIYKHYIPLNRFEEIVDEALANWSIDIKDVRIRTPEYESFFEKVPYAPVYEKEEINKFIPEPLWTTNELKFDIREDEKIFSKIDGLRSFYQVFLKVKKSSVNELFKRIKESRDKENKDLEFLSFWFEVFKKFEKDLEKKDINVKEDLQLFIDCVRKRTLEINNFYDNCYNSALKLQNLVYTQELWIFEYNKNILESKKRIIKQYLENSI